MLRLKSGSAKGASHHLTFIGSHPIISYTFLALPTQRMSSPSRKWERGIGSRLHLFYLWLVWIRRIGGWQEFKIPLCNPSSGNLLRLSCQTSTMEFLCENSERPKYIDCFRKKAPPQTSDQILNADLTRAVVNVGCVWDSWPQAGVQGSGWDSIKLREILLMVIWEFRL